MSQNENNHLDARMVLKLNTPVLNALFPEGTPARIELQQAVVAEFAQVVARQSLNEEAKAYLGELSKTVANITTLEAVVKQYFETKSTWNAPLSITDGGKLAVCIADHVNRSFDVRFYELIEKAVAAAVEKYTSKLESSVQYAVDAAVKKITVDTINKKVSEAVAAARRVLAQ